MPGPGPGSPLSVSLQTSVSKGVSLGAQSLRGVTPAAEGGLGKNLLGKVPEPLFTSRDVCWEGTVSLRRLRGSGLRGGGRKSPRDNARQGRPAHLRPAGAADLGGRACTVNLKS